MMRSRRYRDYMHSPAWRRRRAQAVKRAGFRCERCGSMRRLEVHHLTYARLGAEAPADLRVLCHDCHRRQHDSPLRAALRAAGRLIRKRTTRR